MPGAPTAVQTAAPAATTETTETTGTEDEEAAPEDEEAAPEEAAADEEAAEPLEEIGDQEVPLANQDLKDLDEEEVPASDIQLDKVVKKGLPLAASIGIAASAAACLPLTLPPCIWLSHLHSAQREHGAGHPRGEPQLYPGEGERIV